MADKLKNQTIRRNGKCAKLGRNADGSWTAHMGFEGSFGAFNSVTYPKKYKDGALVAAVNFLDEAA